MNESRRRRIVERIHECYEVSQYPPANRRVFVVYDRLNSSFKSPPREVMQEEASTFGLQINWSKTKIL